MKTVFSMRSIAASHTAILLNAAQFINGVCSRTAKPLLVVHFVFSISVPTLSQPQGTVGHARQSWKVAYPLREVLFLVVCGSIASGGDYEDIVDWGEAHLSFLRGFTEFHHDIPCADWLRTVMNRIDPDMFAACFTSWVAESWPDKAELVAIDGKTSRRSHNRKTGQKALHLVSAFATTTGIHKPESLRHGTGHRDSVNVRGVLAGRRAGE
jgi:DDE_Tnp_1-associated